jgi:hypothetical protein
LLVILRAPVIGVLLGAKQEFNGFRTRKQELDLLEEVLPQFILRRVKVLDQLSVTVDE